LTAALSCIPFFVHFELKSISAKEISLLAIMTVLSVLSRILFAEIPGFKPITAMIVITGISFGAEAGFMTGSLSAFISNIYFGQGPWTPFQMFSWGISGLLAGALAKQGLSGVPVGSRSVLFPLVTLRDTEG
jgi:energy-coupling factor transport system substrate-specific component